jgi:hypothetical protein
MLQFLIAVTIVAFALFIIYVSERIIFRRRPEAAAKHTLWATTADGFAMLLAVLALVLLRALRPALRLLSKRNARLAADKEARRFRAMLQGKPRA